MIRPSATVTPLRPGARPKRPARDAGPPWVALSRHDLLALVHGLTDAQAGAWTKIVAEALSAGTAIIPLERCSEVAGRLWTDLQPKLTRTRRVEIDAGQVRVMWVGEALADATKRIAKARKMRGGHDDK